MNKQPIRNPNQVIDRENIVVFPERFGVAPRGEIEVTFSAAGTHVATELKSRAEGVAFESVEKVDSYLLQYNPPYVEGIPNAEREPLHRCRP